MLKTIITRVIRKRKNPDFQFDENVNSQEILELVLSRIILRVRSLKLYFSGIRSNEVYLGKNVKFIFCRKVTLGRAVTLGENVCISGLSQFGVHIGDRVNIGDFSKLIASVSLNNLGSGIEVGNDVAIGEYSYIGGAGGVKIGKSCIIGQYFSVHPENHVFSNLNTEIRTQGVERQGISIGDNCWVGAKVTVLDGSQIGSGSVIAAGAVVSGMFPDNVVIAGVPAKIIKARI